MIPKRVWFKAPKKEGGWKSQWVGREIPDQNLSNRRNIQPPREFVGNGHCDWELYHHDSTVQKLVGYLEMWMTNSGSAPPIPRDEILKAIEDFKQ